MNKTAKRALAILMAAVMLAAVLPSAAFAAWTGGQSAGAAGQSDRDPRLYAQNHVPLPERERAVIARTIRDNAPGLHDGSGLPGNVTLTPSENPGLILARNTQSLALDTPAHDADEIVRVIVEFESESLLEQGFTNEEIANHSTASANAGRAIRSRQDIVLRRISTAVASVSSKDGITPTAAPDVDVNYYYDVIFNGVSINIPYGALAAVRGVSGVASAFVAPQYDLPDDIAGGAAQPMTYASGATVGRDDTWELGYTGKGMKIAIIDTGLDTDHPSFSGEGFPTTEDSLTEEKIAETLRDLNAKTAYPRLTAQALYLSAKVPYAFCYVDRDLDVTHADDMGDHGTHVAGIAAANKIEDSTVVGIAPDAQLLVMKVFGDKGGAYMDDIAAALEDCFRLGVDAVNMSLGSPAGFSTAGSEWEDSIYAAVADHGMVLAVAAGNSGSAAAGNASGTDLNRTGDPDNGIIASPATYAGATAVASMENTSMVLSGFGLNGEVIPYTDVAEISFASLDWSGSDAGTEYEYVMVPGVGTEEDFNSLTETLWGRVAVIQRGEINFTEKQVNAANAGAAAVIVYDNKDGSLNNMEDSHYLPNIFISKSSGEKLAAAADENGVGTLTVFAGSLVVTENEAAGQMSDFSSWGVAPDLTLAPDITAPGGHIYSTIDDGAYGDMSGTSMASPQVAGMSALVLQYLRDKHPGLSDAQLHTVAESLLMSTAVPIIEESSGLPYSPRWQGSGLANVHKAVTSPAYLTVDGDEQTPKASLGDDDDRTGVYTFDFTIHNFSGINHAYSLDACLLTDQYDVIDGEEYMSETGHALSGEVEFSWTDETPGYDEDLNGSFDRDAVQLLLDAVNGVRELDGLDDLAYDYTGDGVVDTADAQFRYELLGADTEEMLIVPANSSVTVTVTVTLSGEDRAYMDEHYPNGIYVDGFATLDALDGSAVDLSLPFMAFYGDWSAAKVFDTGWWYESEEEISYDKYPHVIFTSYGLDSYYLLGLNPYTDAPYDKSHNAVSPNGDTYIDGLEDIYIGLMRSARELSFVWTDSEGNELDRYDYSQANKSYLNESYQIVFPFMYGQYVGEDHEMYDFTDAEGNVLPNDTVVYLTVSAKLDDGDDEVDERLVIPVTIDVEAPEIHSADLEQDADGTWKLRLEVSDNQYIAAVMPISVSTGVPYEYRTLEDYVPSETATVEIDVTGYDAVFQVAVADYACNETYYTVTLGGAAALDPNSWYGYRYYSWVDVDRYDELYTMDTDLYNGWYSFRDADDMLWRDATVLNGETNFTAAEYVDGYIIAIDETGGIFAIKAGSWTRMPIGELVVDGDYCTAVDMAFDHSTNTLYVLTDYVTDWETDAKTAYLAAIDPLTGVTEHFVPVSGADSQLLTLAAGNDGTLYTVDTDLEDAALYTIDKNTGTVTEVGKTGVATGFELTEFSYETWEYEVVGVEGLYQSMAVDHASGELYWATYLTYTEGWETVADSGFYKVDTATGEAAYLSGVEHNGEMVGLFKPYEKDNVIPDDVEAEELTLTMDSLSMTVGGQGVLEALPVPYYASLSDIEWTSSDDAVAAVDNGVVTAVGVGSAVITAAAGSAAADCAVKVISPVGELRLFDANRFAWVKLETADPERASYVSTGISPIYAITAAAYRDGRVYAYDYSGSFYNLDPETLSGVKVGSANTAIVAMAFNYHDGFMYGLEEKVEGFGWFESYTYNLVRINLSTGEVAAVAPVEPWEFGAAALAYGMAIDYEGSFYLAAIDDMYSYALLKLTLEDDDSLSMVECRSTGIEANETAEVALVYSDANNGLFWADDWGELLWIDLETLEPVYIGAIMNGAVFRNYSMLEILEHEPAVPDVSADSATLPEKLQILVDGSVSAGLSVEPWNSTSAIRYSVADPDIAEVNDNGIITGLKAGTTTLTVEIAGLSDLTAAIEVLPSGAVLHGFAINGYDGSTPNSWISFADIGPDTVEIENDDLFDTEFTVAAGTYYDGTLYTYMQCDESYDYRFHFAAFDTESYEMAIGPMISERVRDMAFDYSTGTLFAVTADDSTGALLQINTVTGETVTVGDCGHPLAAVTVDETGQLYAIGVDGVLYRLNKTSGAAETVGATGLTNCTGYQSMHYDLNTGNVYWTCTDVDTLSGGLYLVDLISGAATELGAVADGTMVSVLYTIPEAAPAIPDSVEPSGVRFDTQRNVLAVGETLRLNATVLPLSVSQVDQTLTWSSSDAGTATVSDGVVTGVAAGTVTITATDVKGHSAQCIIVVTEKPRQFYAYDETNGAWVSFESDGVPAVARQDEEGESILKVSAYDPANDVIYAFDADGGFYQVDPDTFERTQLGQVDGGFGEYDQWGDGFPIEPVDMAYDSAAGKLYLAANAQTIYEDAEWGDTWLAANSYIYEVDTATGELTEVYDAVNDDYDGEHPILANLLVMNGKAYTVDAYSTGILTVIDLETRTFAQLAMVPGYWSEPTSSRSFFLDELTGTVYAVRDFAGKSYEGNGANPSPILYALSLSDGALTEVCPIGSGAYMNGVFIR